MATSTGEFGISAAAAADGDRIVVSGSFTLPVDDDHGQLDQAALVMTIAYRTGYKIIRPFKDKVPFADDVTVSEGSVAGHFDLDFREYVKPGINRYHVLFSIGEHLSPVLEITFPQ